MKTLSQSDAAALKARISQLITASPDRKARWRSMKSVRWCLYSPQLGLWAGLTERAEIVPVTTQAQAVVFDGRDNDNLKLAFHTQITGIAWQIQLVTTPARYVKAAPTYADKLKEIGWGK